MKAKVVILLILSVFIACDDIIEVEDISGKTVTVLAPKNDTVVDSMVVFSWQALEGADSYHLQVATPSFENASQIMVDTLLETTSYTKPLASGVYEWRVRAENPGYETDYTTQNFSNITLIQ